MIQRLIKKTRRLLASQPAELTFRARHLLSIQLERMAYRQGRLEWSDTQWRKRLGGHCPSTLGSDDLATAWHQHFLYRPEPPFLLAPHDLQSSVSECPANFPADHVRTLATANDVCDGEIKLLGMPMRVGVGIDWQADPCTGTEWPKTYWADVALNSPLAAGDPKHVWELNRQEYLIQCGQAFLLSGDPRYVQRAIDLITSWIKGNPFLQGINWASPLEVAVRAIAWLWTLQYCRRSTDRSPAFLLALTKSLYQHGWFLDRHLEYYSSPYNHLIGQATALYLLGCYFPEFDESARWRKRGWQILESCGPEQFHPDGGSVEQATSYHHYCLGFLLLGILTRQRRGEPIAPELMQSVNQALTFSMWLTRPDGLQPAIGDIDNARSIRFGHNEGWDFRNFLSIGALLFQRGDLKSVAGGLSTDAFWLFGPESLRQYDLIETAEPFGSSCTLAASGYQIVRSGWGRQDDFFCFDCGPIAAGLENRLLPSSCHGHCDLLSFELTLAGVPMIVDGGFYTYDTRDDQAEWQRYFREIKAHNSVSVDGCSHASYQGHLNWSHAAKPTPIQSASFGSFTYMQGSHAGFASLSSPVTHQRAGLAKSGSYYLLFDRLDGSGSHNVEVFFHLGPGVKVDASRADGACLLRGPQGIQLWLQPVGTRNFQTEIVENGEAPDRGWLGTGYGTRVRSTVIRCHGRLDLPATWTMLLVPGGNMAEVVATPGEMDQQWSIGGDWIRWHWSPGPVARLQLQVQPQSTPESRLILRNSQTQLDWSRLPNSSPDGSTKSDQLSSPYA